MKIVMLVMSIIICFLIYLAVYFWFDRNFYRNATKFWRKHCDELQDFSKKSNDDWLTLCSKNNKEWSDICYKNCLDWAKAYAKLQEENKRLKNQLAKKEVYKNVK